MFKCKSLAELMKMWLELNKECAAPNVWEELTFEFVLKETNNKQKAEQLSNIAFDLANEVAEDMLKRWDDGEAAKVTPLIDTYSASKQMDIWLAEIKLLGHEQMLQACSVDSGTLIGFESESGQHIIDPFHDESSIYEVDPIAYYGHRFLTSDFFKAVK